MQQEFCFPWTAQVERRFVLFAVAVRIAVFHRAQHVGKFVDVIRRGKAERVEKSGVHPQNAFAFRAAKRGQRGNASVRQRHVRQPFRPRLENLPEVGRIFFQIRRQVDQHARVEQFLLFQRGKMRFEKHVGHLAFAAQPGLFLRRPGLLVVTLFNAQRNARRVLNRVEESVLAPDVVFAPFQAGKRQRLRLACRQREHQRQKQGNFLFHVLLLLFRYRIVYHVLLRGATCNSAAFTIRYSPKARTLQDGRYVYAHARPARRRGT